jgi:hypothetical protein
MAENSKPGLPLTGLTKQDLVRKTACIGKRMMGQTPMSEEEKCEVIDE